MYNENSNFSIRNLILQFLFIVLFIFVLIWIFPMKSDLNNALKNVGNSETDLSMFYDQIFNNNVLAMKDAAKSYYTTPRLPQKVGDKVKMTLREMLDAKIILPFVDSSGDACDLDSSYVEISKNDDEFIMKVNLKCGEQENYLLVYMGCYDYCQTAICESNTSDVKSPIIYDSKTNEVVNNNNTTIINNNNNNTTIINNDNDTIIINNGGDTETPDPEDPTEVEKEYIYEYVLNTGSYTETDWSAWSSTAVTASDTVSVRTKIQTATTLIGYNVKTAEDTANPIYKTEQVIIGYENKTVCTKYDYVATGEYTYGSWTYSTIKYYSSTPKDTSTTYYVIDSLDTTVCGSNCTASTAGYYKVYTRTSTPVTEYKCTEYGTEKTPIFGTKTVFAGYPTIEISRTPVYKTTTTTLYSYKTRTYTGTSKYVWSKYSDQDLLKQGYQYTGNRKEVN
ncbi:MAG: hypothetical protein ACK5HP_03475 [Bacilli bacterium]